MRRVWIGFGILLGLVVVVVIAGLIAIRNIDWNEYKGPVADAAREATGRQLDLSGDLSLAIGLRPGVALNDVSFENAEWGSRPEMARIERLFVQLRLIPLFSGQIEVDRVELIGLDLLLETDAEGNANWEFKSPAETEPAESAPAPDQESDADAAQPLTALVHHLLIENARIVLRDQASDIEQSLTIDRMLARTEHATSPLILELAAHYGDEAISLQGEFTGISQLLAGGALGLDLTLEAGGAETSVAGKIAKPLEATGIDLTIGVAGDEVADWSGLAGSPLPALGAYRVGLAVSGGGTGFEVRDLDVALGDTSLSGELDLDLSGKRPRVAARLTSPRIDLADLQEPGAEPPAPPPAETNSGAPPDSNARVLPDDPLPLEGLSAVDATVSLSVKALRANQIEMSDFILELVLDQGKLRVDPLALGIAGGRVKIAVQLDSGRKRPSFSLGVKGDGIVVGDLAKSQGSDILRGGPVDLRFDLRGRGGSVAEIAGSLGGTLEVEMGQAHIDNEWASLALGDIQSIISTGARSSSASIDCLLTDFAFDKGIGRSRGLVVDLPSIALFGEGSIDLRRERIDLRFDRRAKQLSASQVLPPFKIGGTFAAPRPEIDATALAGSALALGASLLAGEGDPLIRSWPSGCRAMLAAYEEDKTRSVEAKSSTREQGKAVLDGLKGLFGR